LNFEAGIRGYWESQVLGNWNWSSLALGFRMGTVPVLEKQTNLSGVPPRTGELPNTGLNLL